MQNKEEKFVLGILRENYILSPVGKRGMWILFLL